MSLAHPHTVSFEAFPNLLPTRSIRETSGQLKASGRRSEELRNSFASRLDESQSKTLSNKKPSDAARFARKSDKLHTDKIGAVPDDATESVGGEALNDSSGSHRVVDATVKSDSSSALTVDVNSIGDSVLDHNVLTVRADVFDSGAEQVMSAFNSVAENLGTAENQHLTRAEALPSRSGEAASELTDLLSIKSMGDVSARAEAEIAKLLTVTQEQSLRADSRDMSLLFKSADGETNQSDRNTLNSALVQNASLMRTVGAAGQSEINGLLQRFGVEQADLTRSNVSVDQVTKSATSDLQTIALAPNIRQVLVASAQSKRGNMSESAKVHVENESLVSEQRETSGKTFNESAEKNDGRLNTGPQNGSTGSMLNDVMLSGSSNLQAAQIEEFGALVTDSSQDATGAQEQVSKIRSHRAGTSQLRAGFILPDRVGQTLRSGVKSITLQITPKHLGTAQLQVNVVNNNVSGTLFVESAAAKTAVEVSIEQLAQRLAEEGLSLDRLDVEVSERRQDEFGAERRSADKSSPSVTSYKKDKEISDTLTGIRTFQRQSIVTASRIDAVV